MPMSNGYQKNHSCENHNGAVNQGTKDGRKNKKGKKDFSRKESGGSEMDAFIDADNSTNMNNGSAMGGLTEKTLPDIAFRSNSNAVEDSTANVTSQQVESKGKGKKKKKKSKKTTQQSSKPKVEDDPEISTDTKVCPNSGAALSPTGSHSSEGKDSGVDSEPGVNVPEPVKITDIKESVVVADLPKQSEPKIVPDTVEEKVSSSSTASIELTSEESVCDQDTKLAEPVLQKDSAESESLQNCSSVPSKDNDDKETNVPKDNPVNNGATEEILSNMSNDTEQFENESPETEAVELSKAEAFNKLKMSGGKLVYDRAYLMELRECASSQTKPDGLPKLDIILDKPNISLLSRPSGGPADFTPSFFQPAQRHAPPIGKSSSRGRQRPGDMPTTPRVIKSISMSNDTKALHQSENPWKPVKKEDKKEQKGLEGEILFIMNRITPTNFEKMAREMRKLNVKTYEDLQFMVKVFFDKVTIETKFVEAYAQLCKVMADLKVPPPADGSVKEHLATFRVVMLTKCQQEFEADKAIIFENPEEKKKKLEADNPEITPERNEMIENTLYQMKLKRMKFYGNIRFIGELFKLRLLTENIMHDCIYRLLKARDDDSLVSLSNLLTTVGKLLDTEKAKPRMDQYFSQMSKIADERKSRIKFTLKDVIELRGNFWTPRKETTGPKKIDEVHKDFAKEQARNQFLASQPQPPRMDNSQVGSRRGSRQRQEDKVNEDGWNTVSSKVKIEPTKMKFSKNAYADDNIQLGPGGGMHRQPMWSRGSHGGGAQPSQEDRSSFGGSNRFAALNDDSQRSFPRSPSRGENTPRGVRQGPTAGHGRGKVISRSSQEGDRRDLPSNRSYMGGMSQSSSRDNSWNRNDRRQMGPRSSGERDDLMTRSGSSSRRDDFAVPAPVSSVKQLSESEIEKKATNLLEEYISIRDMNEAKLCVDELKGQKSLHCVVSAFINNVLEKNEEARRLTGNLLQELVMAGKISPSMYIKGLNQVLEFASDMVVDIPTLWNCLAQIICPLLIGGSLPWSELRQALTPHLDNKDGAKLLAAILLNCAENQGEKEVSHQWQNSGLSWSNYLKSDEISSFISDKKLSFTLGESSGEDANRFKEIERMIQNHATNKELISHIETNVSGSKTDNSFIRSLTTALVKASISESNKLNEEVLKSHKEVLQKYLGNDADRQLQALYAIQTLMAKLEHPSGILVKLFELFFDEFSIEEEVFYRWEKSDDPQEQESKGTCVMQVRQFFIWLRESEDIES